MTKPWRDSRGEWQTRPITALAVGTTIIVAQSWEVTAVTPLLFQQRADNDWWGFPGGKQEPGESIQDCARRECYEETGLQVELRALVCVDSTPELYAVCVYPDGNCIHYTNLTFLAYCSPALSVSVRESPESRALCWAPAASPPQPFLKNHAWRLRQALMLSSPPRHPVAVR